MKGTSKQKGSAYGALGAKPQDSIAAWLPEKYQIKKANRNIFYNVSCHSNTSYHQDCILPTTEQASGRWTNQPILASSTKPCTVLSMNHKFNPCSVHDARETHSPD